MRPLSLFIGGIFTSVVAANAVLGEDAFQLMTFLSARSFGEPALHGRSLQARACMATCSNGGCCNTGGPCTTDGMCCAAGETACTDGGCCGAGETCTTANNTQVCQGTTSCKAPPVPCGQACCDAGTVCVTTGANYRCQLPGATSSSSTKPATTSSVSRPPLGNPTNRTNTASVSFSGVLSGSKIIPYVTPTTFPNTHSAGSATAAATSSSSSAAQQSISASSLQMLVNILGGIGLVAALVLIN